MFQTILRYLSLVFPHTFTRLAHWHLLLFYDNTGLLDLPTVILAILPSCIHCVYGFAAAHHFHDDDDDDDDGVGPQELRRGAFRVINDCLRYWFLVYKAFDLVAALEAVLRAPGFYGKVLLAIDLFVEGILVLLAKLGFFASVGIFVGAAFGGSPWLKRFFISVWMFLQFIILDLQDHLEEFLEKLRGRNEVPADEPPLEEDVIEEDGVF